MKRFLPLLLLFLGLTIPCAALEIPAPRGYVNDFAGILSPSTRGQLERYLVDFERSDSTQIVVATLPSLEGGALEEVSLRIAEEWKIGQKGRDNGALLLIAKEERKMRIEVGYGLEGRLTDLLAGRIVDNEIRPRFKQGDFDGGVIAGVKAMTEAVRGEYKGTGKTGQRGKKASGAWWIYPLIFFVLPLFMRIVSPQANLRGHHRPGGLWIGGPGGGGGFGGGGGGFSGGGGGFGGGGSSGSW